MGRAPSSDQNGRGSRIPPRGLSRVEAADYVGVSPGTFDKLVMEGTMPEPIGLCARKVWDRIMIDRAFDNLAADNDNAWDEI